VSEDPEGTDEQDPDRSWIHVIFIGSTNLIRQLFCGESSVYGHVDDPTTLNDRSFMFYDSGIVYESYHHLYEVYPFIN
jgi:hypothetical protein